MSSKIEMLSQIDPYVRLHRIEAKVNMIAKAANWILATVAGAAIFFIAHTYETNIQLFWLFLAGGAIGGLLAWLIIDKPMKKLEETFPL